MGEVKHADGLNMSAVAQIVSEETAVELGRARDKWRRQAVHGTHSFDVAYAESSSSSAEQLLLKRVAKPKKHWVLAVEGGVRDLQGVAGLPTAALKWVDGLGMGGKSMRCTRGVTSENAESFVKYFTKCSAFVIRRTPSYLSEFLESEEQNNQDANATAREEWDDFKHHYEPLEQRACGSDKTKKETEKMLNAINQLVDYLKPNPSDSFEEDESDADAIELFDEDGGGLVTVD